ncbi:MAG: hypothetical protein ACJAYR_002874 [Sneathiella sp.]
MIDVNSLKIGAIADIRRIATTRPRCPQSCRLSAFTQAYYRMSALEKFKT